jgi:DNA polymerase III subunit delta
MAKRIQGEQPAGMQLGDFLKTPATDVKPVYVLKGTDPYLLDQGRQEIRQRVIGDADPGLAMLELLGPEAELADVLDALRSPPMLASRRLVLVREAEGFVSPRGAAADDISARADSKPALSKADGADGGRVRDALVRYLGAPSPSGTLCLETATWNESTTLARKIADVGVLVYCEMTDVGKIPGWLQRRAKTLHGKSLTFGAAQMLLEYLGPDFASLVSALEALTLYAGAGETIDVAEVDALVARGHHERVWDFCDAVAERNVPRALELLDAFWTEGMVAPQIVGLLRPTFRQLVRVKTLSQRLGLDGAMRQAAIPYGAKDRVRRAVGVLTNQHLADAFQALVDADLEAKSTPNDRVAMETLVHRLCHAEAARSAGAASFSD